MKTIELDMLTVVSGGKQTLTDGGSLGALNNVYCQLSDNQPRIGGQEKYDCRLTTLTGEAKFNLYRFDERPD